MKKIILAIPTGTLSVLVTLLLLYLSLASNPFDVRSVHLFPNADKCVHFLMYFGCAMVYMYEYAKHRLPHHTNLNGELAIASSLAVMGVFIETAQMTLTSDRSFEWLDCLANATGAFTGFLLMHFWGKHYIHSMLYKTVIAKKQHRHYKKHRKAGQY